MRSTFWCNNVIYKNGLTHFMCLYEIKGNNYILMDPSKGKIKMAKSDFDEIFSGVFVGVNVGDGVND